jgi:FMN phosphatase YigB (HAD superfamily)
MPLQQTVFLDDREENVAAARALDLQAIVFTSPEQVQCWIDKRCGLPSAR